MANVDEAFGWTSPAGWWIHNLGGHATASIVSVHESLHYALDRSTSFGALLYAMGGLRDAGVVADVRSFRNLARTIHESFATFVSDMIVPGTVASPQHQRYRAQLSPLVSGVSSPYLRLHAAWAVARACMQPNISATLDGASLAELTPSAFRMTVRPDTRFRALQSAGISFNAVVSMCLDELSNQARLELVEPATLQGSSLASGWSIEWEQIARLFYEAVIGELATAGMETLHFEGNIQAARDILETVAIQHPQVDLPIAAADENRERVWFALRAVDAEALTLPKRRAQRVDWNNFTTLDELAAGSGESDHIHIAIRPIDSYLSMDWANAAPTSMICSRRTMQTAEGRVIEHVDLASLDAVAAIDRARAKVILTIAESTLTAPDAAAWWHQLKGSAFLLADTPLVPRLEAWFVQPDRVFRFTVVQVDAADATLPVLVGRFETSDGVVGAPHLRPLSPQSAGMVMHGLGESELGHSRAIRDSALLTNIPYLELALFHVVGEDRSFQVREQRPRGS